MPPKKKKLAGLIKLQIQAGQANPAPPVGPALGQHGVNIMEFCKAYNAATESQRGNVIPVEISVYEDRTFNFKLKTPPAAKLLLKAAGVQKGSGEPHKTKVAKVTMDQVREIAKTKQEDLNANDIEQPRRSSPAPPGRWVSRSSSPYGHPWEGQPGPPTTTPTHTDWKTNEQDAARHIAPRPRRSTATTSTPRCRPRSWPRRPRRQDGRDRRGRRPAGRRSAQGGPDGPRHGQPAARHR